MPGTNGCGAEGGGFPVPNNPLSIFHFESPCDSHDFCYGSGLDKGFCDNQFDANMSKTCPGGFVGAICSGVKGIYYGFVHFLGGSAYENAQAESAADLNNQIAACGGNSECIQKAQNGAAFDDIMNWMQACESDQACEHAAANYYDQDGTVDGWVSNDGGCGGIMCDGNLGTPTEVAPDFDELFNETFLNWVNPMPGANKTNEY